jgi:hypothetical protein
MPWDPSQGPWPIYPESIRRRLQALLSDLVEPVKVPIGGIPSILNLVSPSGIAYNLSITSAGALQTTQVQTSFYHPGSTIASDNFNRALLGANWGTNDNAMVINNSTDIEPRNIVDYSTARWLPTTFPPDQSSQATITALGSGDAIGVAVRMDPAGARIYYAFFLSSNTATLIIYDSIITVLAIRSYAANVGDVILLQVIGNKLNCMVNGVSILTATDNTLTSGQPGIEGLAAHSPALSRVDNWSAVSIISNWTVTVDSLALLGDGVYESGTSGTSGLMYWNVSSFPADQQANLRIDGLFGDTISFIGPAVRVAASGNTRYAALVRGDGQLILQKMVAGTPTILGTLPAGTVHVEDVVAISAVQSTITVYLNGNAVLSAIDSAIAGGQPGIAGVGGQSGTNGTDWAAISLGTNLGELISYQAATLTSSNKYAIDTRIRRGVYNSLISTHPLGSAYMLLDDSVEAWNYDPILIGKTVFFKFTSFNQSGLLQELLANVIAYPFTITGQSIGLLTPAHITYRPTSNPLTAHDAGSSATIFIASFSMRVPGIADIVENSGSITGLVYNTLYYVYFDDPGFVGGAVIYLATTVKETALSGAGRFFVGSILAPIAGAQDTVGNGDGGSGAQSGNVYRVSFINAQAVTIIGSFAIINPYGAIDGDTTTFATIGCAGGNDSQTLELLNAPSIIQRPSSIAIKYWRQITVSSGAVAWTASLYDPTGSSQTVLLESLTNPGVDAAPVLITIPLALNVNINNYQFRGEVSGTGSMTLKLFETWFEYTS